MSSPQHSVLTTQSSPVINIFFSQRTARFPEILRVVADRDASPGSDGDQEAQAKGIREALPSWQLSALPAECGSLGLPSLTMETEVTFGS